MKTWFISDTHFGHENIITFKGRPFKNADEMDDALVNYWNKDIAEEDIVYHLGDFTFLKQGPAQSILNRLNGRKTLILGNHDQIGANLKGWVEITNYKEIWIEGKKIVLFHYPLVEWNNYYKGSWHLHGHVHGSRPDPKDKYRLDMAVENYNYSPVSFDKVKNIMAKKEIVL